MSPEDHSENVHATFQIPPTCSNAPLLIGDGIHVLNPEVHKALLMRDGKWLSCLVRKQLAAGFHALAVNLGPGREMGRLTPWIVDTIREVTDLPMFFSANIIAQKQVLKVHGQRIVINAVTANDDELVHALVTAREHGSSLVVLLVHAGRMPGGIDYKLQLASQVLERAELIGFPLSRLYLDPVLTCRPDPIAWHVSRGVPDVGAAVETMAMIRHLDTRVKTIVALSNSSDGMAREQRSGFQARMLSLFTEEGVDAVLLNCLDGEVMASVGEFQRGREYN